MIGRLSGTLLTKQPPWVLLDIQGVGYEVQVPMTTCYRLPEIGQPVLLFTHLVVREDAHLLFGFSDQQERALFRELIKVNGIGPKVALVILSGMDGLTLLQCVTENNVTALVRLPGIGKKTAERLLIELRDRLPALFSETPSFADVNIQTHVSHSSAFHDAVNALISLGYKLAEAKQLVQAVLQPELSCEELIRLALQNAK
ncbi:MAG: Holliday junction branch migration protein RuvA [Gammaproteobacteria bacterium]